MMMIAAAGHGHERRALYESTNRPIPRWVWGAVGVSILAHVAGAVWLYNQRYEMPVEETTNPPATVIELWNPPTPPEPVEQVEASRPPPPIHRPANVPVTPTQTSPFTPPDHATEPVEAGLPLVDPTPTPTEGGTATEPTPPVPAVIRNPQWVRQPSAAQMERAYPRGAAAEGTSGRATLSCRVTGTGEVTGCSILAETPEGEGFGRAAMSLSRYFRLSPRTVDGQTIEGARVTIPLSFNIG